MSNICTGVILAGGLSQRLSGRNKAMIDIGGKTILDRIHAVFSGFFEETILVTNDPLAYLQHDVTIVTDLYKTRCALAGLHAGLYYANTPYAFVTACDTPFIQKGLLELIISSISPGIDIVLPETSAGTEQLCAVYSKKCLGHMERQLDQGNLQIKAFFNRVRIKPLSEKKIRRVDPQLQSFININTQDDLAKISELGHTC